MLQHLSGRDAIISVLAASELQPEFGSIVG
jgi:hypothetical protein